MTRELLTAQAIQAMRLTTDRPIGEHTNNVMVHCPFHTDKTASMTISLSKGLYHCFSCQEGGSIEKLFKQYTGLDLYKTLGISRDEFSNFASKSPAAVEDFEDALSHIHIAYDVSRITSYKNSTAAVAYLRKRGIPFLVADQMAMKYTEGVKINGLWMQKRLLVPVYDHGKLVSIEARDVTGSSPKKCLYPPKSSVSTLYDIDNLDYTQPLYVVEGLMDLAILRKYPQFANSTSIFGASLSHRQLFLLRKFDKIIYIPDNDAPGEKVLAVLKEQKLLNAHYLRLPKSLPSQPDILLKDVGDYEVKTPGGLQQLLTRKWLTYARPLNEYITSKEK
jgi:DNA primase